MRYQRVSCRPHRDLHQQTLSHQRFLHQHVLQCVDGTQNTTIYVSNFFDKSVTCLTTIYDSKLVLSFDRVNKQLTKINSFFKIN